MNFEGPPRAEPSAAGASFDGLTFVITGTLEGFTREEATAEILARSGKVTGSVSKKTTYVLGGREPGYEARQGGAARSRDHRRGKVPGATRVAARWLAGECDRFGVEHPRAVFAQLGEACLSEGGRGSLRSIGRGLRGARRTSLGPRSSWSIAPWRIAELSWASSSVKVIGDHEQRADDHEMVADLELLTRRRDRWPEAPLRWSPSCARA